LEGTTTEAGEQFSHRFVLTVTDLTKEIDGVRTRIVYDRDYRDDQLVEAELAFFAQDRDGNVWHFGQYVEDWDETGFIGGHAWLQGYLEGARAGIMVPADPQLNRPDFSQGFAPDPINWTDRAFVAETGVETTVPHGTFSDVIVIEEYSATEPVASQTKYYARGVGNVRVGWRGNDPQQEVLELVEVIELDAAAVDEVRAEALELEARASVYGRTPPAEQDAAGP
jgi:hypothetical protein